MFNCEVCGKTSQPREAAHRIVLEIRDVIYPKRPKVNTCWKRVKDGSKFVRTDDSGGVGFESVREVMVCSDCARQLSANAD